MLDLEAKNSSSIYLQTNRLDHYLFSNKIAKKNEQRRFNQDDHWGLKKERTSCDVTARFLRIFESVKSKKFALLRTMISTNPEIIAKAIVNSVLFVIFSYNSPFLINKTLTYVMQPEKDMLTGVLLALGIILSRVLLAVFDSQTSIFFTIMEADMINGINGLVYEKCLTFPLIRSTEHSFGSLVNHIQVDSQKLSEIGWILEGFFVVPISMAIGFYFMYTSVGLSFLTGIGVILFMMWLNYVIGKKFLRAEEVHMEKKDERIKITSEILNGIKYIKMLGQEKFFLNKVDAAREEELKWMRKQFICHISSIFSLWITPLLTTGAIFGVYMLIGQEVTAQSAFTTLSTLMVLEFPIRTLPTRISYALEFKVAQERVSKFLLAKEIQTGYIRREHENRANVSIKITNGNFYWRDMDKTGEVMPKTLADKERKSPGQTRFSELELSSTTNLENQALLDDISASSQDEVNKLILKNINLEVKKGAFIAILGDVGSGKSSLLYSLVGEMSYNMTNPPQTYINGSVSHLSQQPWILNTTIKNNIVFGSQFDPQNYKDAIKYSCLESDLDILIHKDETEIGEKGVNLSGGQKARVNLARALYRQSDIYLLDDPLSAVDAHVGNFILKECFMGYLKDKTRVLVTHKFETLKYVDHIYIFKDGKIVEEGTLENLKNSPIFQEVEQKYRMRELEEEKDKNKTQQETESINQTIREANLKNVEMETRSQQRAHMAHEYESLDLDQKLMLDEDREVGNISWNVWKSYFAYYGGKTYYTLLFLVMVTWIILQGSSNLWLSYWCDHADKYSRAFFFEGYFVLTLGSLAFCFFRVAMLYHRSLQCSRVIHKDMFSKIIRAPVNLFFDRVPIGRVLNRLNMDLSVLDNSIASTFDFFIAYVFSLAADIVVCLFVGSYWIFPLILIFLVASYKLQTKKMNLKREVNRLENISKSPIISHFSESLNGLTAIRVYEDQKRFLDKFHNLRDENMKNMILSGGINCWFNIRITLWSAFLVVPFIASSLLLNDTYTQSPGLIGFILMYSLSINEDVTTLLWAYANFEADLVALERCHAFTKIQGEASKMCHIQHNLAWPEKGTIEFRNYSVRYRPNLPLVVKDISFIINAGEKIGVVGKTGSGKSTLFLSLLRILEPSQGKILIDNTDISQVDLDDLRCKITTIPQDPILFNGTLRQNLDLLGVYSDQQLWESLARISLREKFEQDKGLDTEIKEGGGNLSAGEKQLICIGRAILAKTKVILIDEATSNIDPKTEQVILDTIQHSFADCTVITIAHRLKTVINSDKILVMKDGELMEYNTPHRLINDADTLFYKLWREHEHHCKNSIE